MHVTKRYHKNLDSIANFAPERAPIVSLGWRTFSKGDYDGELKAFDAFSPNEFSHFRGKIPRKFVGIGAMDQNWGWLSTAFLNRTVVWAFRLDGKERTSPGNDEDAMRSFLDDPNLIMLAVNQHTNITHPKVISVPLGVTDPALLLQTAKRIVASDKKKGTLLFSAGSSYGTRPAITRCVQENMGKDFVVTHTKTEKFAFFNRVARSVAVLCLPGLGYDTFRLWETLLLGSIPVIGTEQLATSSPLIAILCHVTSLHLLTRVVCLKRAWSRAGTNSVETARK